MRLLTLMAVWWDAVVMGTTVTLRLHDAASAIGSRTMGSALDGWRMDMVARGRKPRTLRQFRAVVEECAAHCGWKCVDDVRLEDVTAFVASKRESGQWRGTTADGKMSMLRCFGAYLVKAGDWERNRLEHVPKSGDVGEMGARALTVEEARRLVWVVKMRVERDGRAKASTLREVLVMLKTGWRPSMLYGVRRCDLVLDAAIPHCVTHPSWCKNKRRMTVALDAEVVKALREQLEAVPGGENDAVFPQQTTRATWRSYVGSAGIDYGTKATGYASMYATRKTFATWLDESGCPDGVRESLLCHFDPYVKPTLRAQHDALTRLPRLLEFFAENNVENEAGSGIYSGGGPRRQTTHSYVQPKTRQRNPESAEDRQTSLEVRGLPRFQGCSQPSTEPNPTENGHFRIGQAGPCAVLERVLGLIEAHNDLMRQLLEVCERQGAFDDGREPNGGGEG